MKRPSAVVDTNVIVSGLISGNPASPACRTLDGMLAGSFTFILSPVLLAEYRSVLLRPRIRPLHGLDPENVDRILAEIVVNAVWREPSQAVSAPDPGDDHLWALLNTSGGQVLVTGDRLLLDCPPDFASVLSPRSFMELLEAV